VGPDDAENVARCQREAQALEHLEAAETLGEALDAQLLRALSSRRRAFGPRHGRALMLSASTAPGRGRHAGAWRCQSIATVPTMPPLASVIATMMRRPNRPCEYSPWMLNTLAAQTSSVLPTIGPIIDVRPPTIV